MSRVRLVWGLLLILALLLPASASGQRIAMAQSPDRADPPDRLVLAFYYTWFDEASWGANRVPDQPPAPYVSRDRAVMARHIAQAQAAGIDALVVSWYGPQVVNNQTETNFRAMLDEAAARGFRLAVDFEVTSPFVGSAADAQAALSTLLATHARHPAYLRVGGKPVVFFWRQGRFDTAAWAAIRSAVDPGHASLWIEEGVDVSPLSVFDGHHLYSVTWNPPTDLGYTAGKFARLVRGYAASAGVPKVYVATVMPGYDDRKTGRGSAFATDREGGAYYARSWQAAIASAPDWIIITSFNEWPEGTYIEPSRAYESLYLELTARWSAAFRGSAAVPAGAPVVAPQAAPSSAPATPTPVRSHRPRFQAI